MMFTFLDALYLTQMSTKLILILIITLVNGLLLFAIVSIITRRLKAFPAKHRHLIWFFVICCFLLIPLIASIIPSFDLPSQRIPLPKVLRYDGAEMEPITFETVTTSTQAPGAQGVNTTGTVSTIGWHIITLALWVSGVSFFLLRILVGRIGLLCMMRHATPILDPRSTSIARSVSRHFGIRKRVRWWKSGQCITPFTCYLFKPVILLPRDIECWSEERLRVVLLHELSHIKRGDHIIRFMARILCSVFWFAPPIWLAYRHLQIEEEKACDALVVDGGIEPSSYAKHIVDIVRMTRGTVLLLGLQHSFGRKSTLEARIRNILRLEVRKESGRIGTLVRVLTICFVWLLVLQVVNPLNARNSREAPVEFLYGRWVNNDLDYSKWENCQGDWYQGKVVLDPDGLVHYYITPDCPEMDHVGCHVQFTVIDRYTDREGNNWYRSYSVCLVNSYVFYDLWRIDPSGSVLEAVHSFADYPSEINPDDFNYAIYYRQ